MGTTPCVTSEEAGIAEGNKSGFARITEIFQTRGVIPQLVFKLSVSFCSGLIHCMVPQYAMSPFGFTAAETSRLMLISSGMQLLSQGVLVPMMKTPKLWQMQLAAIVGMGLPLFSLAVAPTNGVVFACCVGSIAM